MRHVASGNGEISGLGAGVNVPGIVEHAEGHVAPEAGSREAAGFSLSAMYAARRAEGGVRPEFPPHSGRLRRRALLVADWVGLLATATLLAWVTTSVRDVELATAIGVFLFFAGTTIPLWAALATASGLYRREEQRADLTVVDDFGPVIVASSVVSWIIAAASTLIGIAVPTTVLVGLWAAMIALVLGSRAVSRTIVRRQSRYAQNTLIVGAGDVGQLLGRKLAQHPELGLRLVGFVDDDPKSMRRDLGESAMLGTPDEIKELVERARRSQRIVIAFSNERHDRQLELVHALRDLDVQIDVVPAALRGDRARRCVCTTSRGFRSSRCHRCGRRASAGRRSEPSTSSARHCLMLFSARCSRTSPGA